MADAVWQADDTQDSTSTNWPASSMGEGTNVDAFTASAKAEINTEVASQLDTAIPGSPPTLNSINERLKALDDLKPATTMSSFNAASDVVDVDRIDGSQSALDNFKRLLDVHLRGTADAGGTTTTMVDEARDETGATTFVGMTIIFTSGTNINRSGLITGFTSGSPATITFTPALGDAVTTENYVIIPTGRADMAAVDAAPQTAGDLAALIVTADTVVDAIKLQTDKFNFGVANQLDVNVESINTAGVTGDGNATPWDGA